MAYSYPTELDQSPRLLTLLGSHWSSTYAGRQTVEDLLAACALLARQTLVNANEAAACVSLQGIPVFHDAGLVPVTLLESQVNANDLGVLRFDDESVSAEFDSDSGYRFDTNSNRPTYSFAVPRDIRRVLLASDGLSTQAVTLTAGLDFSLNAGLSAISFNSNPFTDVRWRPEVVYNEAGDIDRSLVVWLHGVLTDARYVHLKFGHVLGGLELPSSANQRQLVVAASRAVTHGLNRSHVVSMLSAATGVRMAVGGDVVEALLSLPGRKVAITDRSVYEFSPDAEWLVAVGDVLAADAPLVDALRFTPARFELLPVNSPGLCVGRGLLQPGLLEGELFFENRNLPVSVSSERGLTSARFPISGTVADVARFWAAVRDREAAADASLAELLDVRESPVGQPTANSLPPSINPCEFLLDNLLPSGTTLAHVRLGSCQPEGLGLQSLDLLQSLLPPWVMLLLLVELNAGAYSVMITEPGTDLHAGFDSDADIWPAMLPVSVNVYVDLVGQSAEIQAEPPCG